MEVSKDLESQRVRTVNSSSRVVRSATVERGVAASEVILSS